MSRDLDPAQGVGTATPGLREEDRALVARILSGDEDAWERFVRRYAGLIHAIARRYLRTADRDDVHTVFADVLVALRRSKLESYEGRAALSTWLALVTRTHVVDHLRRRFGRSLRSGALKRLEPKEQKLFLWYYIEGRSPADIVSGLSSPEDPWTLERFCAAVRHVERRLGDPWLRRLAYDLHAQSVGASSGRMLEYLDHVRDEYQQQSGAFSPEYHVMEREARHTADRMREHLSELGPSERRLLEMRFERGWSAPRIAQELGMDRPRGVYTAIERIVRRLRRALLADGEPDA